MKTTPHLPILAGSILALALTHTLGQDWPQWRGPNRDGKAAAFTAPAAWPKELAAKWKVTVGDGVATPALVGDRLYVFARQEGKEILRCLEAGTGKELWSEGYDSLGAEGPAGSFSGPRATPTVADGKVVTLGVRGVLSCFDAATGKLFWRKDEFEGAVPRFYTSASPIVTGGLCIAELGGPDNGGVVAYDVASGDVKWRWTNDSPGYASPVLFTLDGTRYVMAVTDKKIVALGVSDGALAWETPYAAPPRGYNAATPIVDGQVLFYAGSGRGVTAVRLAKQGGALTAQELWKNTDNSVQFSSPVLKDGYLYALSAGNDLFCLNAQDGKTAWTAPLTPATAGASAAPPPGPGAGAGRGGRGGGMGGARPGFGSVTDAGKVLMALTPAAELVVFEPSAKAFTEVARVKLPGNQTHGYPVLSGQRLFLKDQDSVALLTVP